MARKKQRTDVFGTTKRRITIVLVAFLLILTYLLTTILGMQLFSFDYYQDKVLGQITTTSSLRASRGKIYDRHGNILAESITLWRVFLTPVDIREASKEDGVDYADKIASLLSPILGISYDTIYQKASNSRVIDATLSKKADEATYKKIVDIIKQNSLGNMIHTEAYQSRYYPEGDFLCHVLGFTGSDSQGLFGLEYQYNDYLTGTDGSYLYAKDASGNEMPDQYVTFTEPIDGSSLITTIDSYLQQQLEYQVNEILATFQVQNRVTGVVMDVNTGAILAMATTNGFDCNDPYVLDTLYQAKLEASGFELGSEDYKKLKNELLYTMWSNKAIGELYEPGSTFKIFTAAVGLETGATTMSSTYSCTGSLRVGGYNISCHKRGGHGSGFTFSYGLQNSCNPTMMTVAARIGANNFYAYFEKFGYLDKTGIDLPSEATTLFHKLENIGSTELATASFGQRFKVTIIQQLRAVACVANGGTLVTPYLVEQIVAPDGTVTFEHQAEEVRQVISEETAKQIALCLEGGVSGNGGAKNAYVAGYQIAAKTGTSQKFDILDENGNSYLRVGSCVAFAPADDAKIAMIIVVDEPQYEKYGSIVAAPYISAFMEKALPYLECKASFQEKDRSFIPSDYTGQSVLSVANELKKQGVAYRIIGDGKTITKQMPESGMEMNAALGTVLLYTNGEEDSYTAVPSLIGLTAQEATEALLKAGLNVHITGAKNYYIGKDVYVTSQSIEAGFKVKRGTIITLTFRHTDGTE